MPLKPIPVKMERAKHPEIAARGNAHDVTQVEPLAAQVEPEALLGDKGYSSIQKNPIAVAISYALAASLRARIPRTRPSICQARKKSDDLVGWHGLAIQVSLDLDAAFAIQTPHLLLSFDAFRGRGHAKAHS
jgi:hypothetical protein